MSNIIEFNKHKYKELDLEEKKLSDGITLEYICNKFYYVSVHELAIDGWSQLIAVSEISGIYEHNDSVFGVFEKSQALNQQLYFLTSLSSFSYSDFLIDKESVANYLVEHFRLIYPDKSIDIINV